MLQGGDGKTSCSVEREMTRSTVAPAKTSFSAVGDDVLGGGAGADFLFGGKGADTFTFASPEEGPDRIAGFRSGIDAIEIDVPVDPATVTFLGFEDSTSPGPAAGAALIYSERSGKLQWDPTGGSHDDQVLVARVSVRRSLSPAICC